MVEHLDNVWAERTGDWLAARMVADLVDCSARQMAGHSVRLMVASMAARTAVGLAAWMAGTSGALLGREAAELLVYYSAVQLAARMVGKKAAMKAAQRAACLGKPKVGCWGEWRAAWWADYLAAPRA